MVDPSLQRLARLYGVQAVHRDGFRQDRYPEQEALFAVLRTLGADVVKSDDVPREIRRAEIERWERISDPVSVSWLGQGSPPERDRVSIRLRLPVSLQAERLDVSIENESGTQRQVSAELRQLPCRRKATVHSRSYAVAELPIGSSPLGVGYYRYRVSVAGREAAGLLVRAPRVCFGLKRGWGAFAPLYALHSRNSPGVGTFTDLSRLTEWVGSMGGGFVSTLPLLASFLDEPFEPSPYMPVSRCFWNELFVDLPSVPEWSPEFGGVGDAPAGRHIDYRILMRGKRVALEKALARLSGQRHESFARFVERHAELRAYAAFRAGLERGLCEPPEFTLQDPACAYHAFAQWLAEEQLSALTERSAAHGHRLCLDLPLGAHPRGFDSHRHADIFSQGIAAGAPPDRFFSKGQNWGFAPINPRLAREQGHAYFIACIRHHMRFAGVLRVDHLMGLHRLYWIPEGFGGDQGVYVRYPAEELYAILCLESQRSNTAVVGEDLGTVPGYVRQRMADHGLRRMYVAQFEYRGGRNPPYDAPARQSVASVNTHDTAMFASFWTGRDIDDQVALGLLDDDHADDARTRRRQLKRALLSHLRELRLIGGGRPSADAVLRACLTTLGASDAECVIVTLEDLWGETDPQNTPGTDQERPNWTRRARLSLEQIRADRRVVSALTGIARARRSSAQQD
ncbi:MAG: 4-alpha-glucanotransferase [Bryobacterales bacterium]|nr:4-alpha-glucanotransferase [Bryobacterales bacterium]MDE0623665.1 4-alpha-glucanotransferase [Bryobacterales bacterium]